MTKKLLFPAVIVLLYLSISLYRLQDIPPPWHDEIVHLNTAGHLAREGRIWCDFYNSRFKEGGLFVSMPLQWVLLGAYVKFFGMSLSGARLLYVILGLITLCAAYLLARRMFNERMALYSLIFLASNYIFLHNSRQLIPQVPSTMFVVIALLLFYTASGGRSGLFSALSGFSAALAYLSHPVGSGITLAIIILFLYRKAPARDIFLFVCGLFVVILPYLVYILQDPGEYLMQTSIIVKEMYPQQPLWLSIVDEIPQRYFRLPPLKDAFVGLGGTGAYFTNLKHMVKNLDLRIYLCGIIGPVSYLLSLIWLGFKKPKSGIEKELFLLTAVYAVLLSLHPNKFGPYIYIISPFMSICLALLVDNLSWQDLLKKRWSHRGALAFFIAALFLASNLAFIYKELNTMKVAGYLPFIARVKEHIPEGACVAGPTYFWIGMHKDYRFVSANEIEYEADKMLREGRGGAKFSRLPTAEQDDMIKAILARHNVSYCLITCHNWDQITEGPGLADGFGGALRRYLFYNAEKRADFLKENYYPGRPEAAGFQDEIYFPPHDSMGFYNVSSEYQNSLKIYRLREPSE